QNGANLLTDLNAGLKLKEPFLLLSTTDANQLVGQISQGNQFLCSYFGDVLGSDQFELVREMLSEGQAMGGLPSPIHHLITQVNRRNFHGSHEAALGNSSQSQQITINPCNER